MSDKHNIMAKLKTQQVVFAVDPEQGTSHLLKSAPKGYKVSKIVRNGTRAIVTYELKKGDEK